MSRVKLYDRLSLSQPEDIDEVLAEAGFLLVDVTTADQPLDVLKWQAEGLRVQRRKNFAKAAEIVRELKSSCRNMPGYHTPVENRAYEKAAKAIEAQSDE